MNFVRPDNIPPSSVERRAKCLGSFFRGKTRLIRRVIKHVILRYSASPSVSIFIPEDDYESNQICQINELQFDAHEVLTCFWQPN